MSHATVYGDEFAGGEPAGWRRAWHAAIHALLVLVFVTGGSSQAHGWTDVSAQLLALPVLGISIWRLSGLQRSRVRSASLVAMAAIALLPWLQLLPLPAALLELSPARQRLAADLGIAGVAATASTWSLTPAATLRGALSLLPALALFVAVLGVNAHMQRRLLALCVILPIASLVIGSMQLGAPQDSLLNPYPQWAPAMGGTFANPNHQGTAMLVGLGICLAFVIGGFGARDEHTGRPRNPWPAVIAGGMLLFGLPVTNSRAAVVIGVLMLVIAPLAMAVARLRGAGHDRRGIAALLAATALAALGLSAAMGWMKVDQIQELRWVMRDATLALGTQHLPWGSGVGSFVPVFQQALPNSLLMPEYINAAHNDYAQAWLEAGIAGVLVALGAAAVLALAMVTHVRQGVGDRRMVWSALLGMFALLAHAGADYALRTPAMMSVAALLAAVLVAQASRPGRMIAPSA